jgi:ketosteroid isomerase-like protein
VEGLRYFLLTPHVKADYYPVRPMTQRANSTRRLQHSLGLVALLAMTVLVWHGRADAQHPKRHDQYKHQVEKLEDVWRAAELSGDVAAMDELLSDDYVGITMSGQVVTKMQQLDRMRNRQLVLTKIVLDDMKVKLIGTTAIVQSLADVDGTNDGDPMHGTYRYMRVYSRSPSGTWKITNFEATRVGPGPMHGRHDHEAVPSPQN